MVAAVLATVLLAGCTSPPAPPFSLPPLSPSPSPSPVTAITSSSPLIGAYEPGVPSSWSPLASFAAATGVNPRIAVYYSGWYERFRATFAQTARDHGSYVLVQIEPAGVTLASIAAGEWDSYLRSYALSVREFGYPVILSFGHEMNGGWYSWGAGHESPSVFVAAWRHIVGVFRSERASNAVWAWSVNSVNATGSPLRQWWPGASWVDLVGIDGYYYRPTDTYGSVFGRTIAQIRTFTDDPVLITETAVGVTSDREKQIKALMAGVHADDLVGVIWFDKGQHQGTFHQDWRLEDDPAALAEFRAATRQYLSG